MTALATNHQNVQGGGIQNYLLTVTSSGSPALLIYPDSRRAVNASDAPVLRKNITKDFVRELKKWKRATAHLSLIDDKITHPSYVKITSMGDKVVPLILRELEKRPTHWFAALEEITGRNAVPDYFNGTAEEVANIWIDWGKRAGYSW